MQFTNRKGNGTYALVVRRCPAARLDPSFERGATNLLNAMKAAICLFDIELLQMPADIRLAYRDNMQVLGIFPVAAYNGGPRNVTKLYAVIRRMGVELEDLRSLRPEHAELLAPGAVLRRAGVGEEGDQAGEQMLLGGCDEGGESAGPGVVGGGGHGGHSARRG